jgi:hypothetical protein
MLKKKIWANFQRIFEVFTFYPKNVHYALKYMGLGFGIRKKPIPDPGSRNQGQKGTGSRIRIRNTGTILDYCTVLGNRRIRMFLGLQDPDPFLF